MSVTFAGANLCTLADGHLGPHAPGHTQWTEGCCNEFVTQHTHYRESRPCPGCGFVAIRTVWPAYVSEPTHTQIQESVSHCGYCRLLHAARRHEHMAERLRNKATAMLRKRQERTQ